MDWFIEKQMFNQLQIHESTGQLFSFLLTYFDSWNCVGKFYEFRNSLRKIMTQSNLFTVFKESNITLWSRSNMCWKKLIVSISRQDMSAVANWTTAECVCQKVWGFMFLRKNKLSLYLIISWLVPLPVRKGAKPGRWQVRYGSALSIGIPKTCKICDLVN